MRKTYSMAQRSGCPVSPVSAGSRPGATHSPSTNQARANAPTLKMVSPGTRIQTSRSTIGCCMNSAERA